MAPSLPAEIWRQIFQNFCVHCQQPRNSDNLPDFRLSDAREGKAALRSLCLVSRECRALSQDILFHSFYNLSDGGYWRRPTEKLHWKLVPKELAPKELAPRMLRTLVSNPCLAENVRMMALFNLEQFWFEGITRQDLQSWSQVCGTHNIEVPQEITTALNPEDSSEDPLIFFDQPGPTAQLQPAKRDTPEARHLRNVFCLWMYYLLIKLTPNLTHLQLEDPLEPFPDPKLSGRVPETAFPNVRVLAYNHFCTDVKDIVSSLAYFPNVTTFACYDSACAPSDNLLSREPIDSAPMTNIRKLSISCWPDALSNLLKFCPHLEDLEVHINTGSRCDEVEWHLEFPSHTMDNLRRLVWSDQESNELLGDHRPKIMLAPLTDFRRLEILGIDQASLLLNSRKSIGKISRYVLPETLRLLHVAFADDISSVDEICDILRELAAAKKTGLPHLSIVRVDHLPPSTIGFKALEEAMDAAGVGICMDKAGIDLRSELEEPLEVREDMRGDVDSRRILPRLRGSDFGGSWPPDEEDLWFVEHPCEIFPLEDLESL